MCVLCNADARSRNHWCGGKAKSITYFERVTVGLGIQHAMSMRHIVICGLSGVYKIFPFYPTNGAN
jgi:hypothetical protein